MVVPRRGMARRDVRVKIRLQWFVMASVRANIRRQGCNRIPLQRRLSRLIEGRGACLIYTCRNGSASWSVRIGRMLVSRASVTTT